MVTKKKTEQKDEEIEFPYAVHVEAYIPDDRKNGFKGMAMLRRLITQYRNAHRQAAAWLFWAEVASCEVRMDKENLPTLVANNDKAKKLLELLTDKPANGYALELVPVTKRLLPGWSADFHWNAIRKVVQVWTSKDGLITTARRNFLAWNTERFPPAFHKLGISLRAPGDRHDQIVLDDHRISVRVMKDEEPLQFRVGTVDKRTYARYMALQRGILDDKEDEANGRKVKPGAVTLKLIRKNERDAIRFTFTYKVVGRVERADTPLKHTMEIAMAPTPVEMFSCEIIDGKTVLDQIKNHECSAVSALWHLDHLANAKDRINRRRFSAGGVADNNHWDAKDTHNEQLNRITVKRRNSVRTWNHVWTGRLASCAKRWKVARVLFHQPSKLFAREWQWAEFCFQLKYKLNRIGVELKVVKAVSAEEALDNTAAD